jgi:hypothetical protein
MVDANGNTSYSNIISIKTKGNLNLQLSPNPVTDIVKINGLKGKGQLKIIDLSGRVMLKQEVVAVQTISIDVSAFAKGMYLVEYFDGTVSTMQKFNKQ